MIPATMLCEDLADQQRSSFFQNVRRCGQFDSGAHAHVKDREDGQSTAEKRLGKGAEELRSAGSEGNDGCADRHRDHHQAARRPLDRAQYRDLFHGKENQKTTHQSNRGRITLACIARKSLEICGRCRLWQQNSPAAPKNSSQTPIRRRADTPHTFPQRRLFAMGASVADIRKAMLDFGRPEQH